MTNEFIPYEQALALKELGFDEPCFTYYFCNGILSDTPRESGDDIKYQGDCKFDNHQNSYLEEDDDCSAPTFSQAFRWFREKYGLMHIINPYDFTAEINYLNKRVVNDVYGDFIPHDHLVDDEGEEIKHLSYEEAETACLLELINICKKK
jgi:hypothetical protein